MLIILEGSDFSGKSTVAARLHQRLAETGWETAVRRTCLQEGLLERLAGWAYRSDRAPGAMKSVLFHMAYLSDALLWKDQDQIVTVQESCHLRVKAHDIVLRRWFGLLFFGLIGKFILKTPLSFFLRCSLEERRRRWQASAHGDERDEKRFNEGLERTRALDETLETLCRKAGYFVIDTGRLSVDQSVDHILEAISAFGGSSGRQGQMASRTDS